MNLKIFISGLIFFLFFSSSVFGEDSKTLSRVQFAHKLKQMIIDNDIEGFDRLHIGQLLNDGTRGDVFSVILEDKYYGPQIFGTDINKFSVRRFLMAQETSIFIDEYGDIVFYIPQKIKFPGEYSEEQHRHCWNVCYIQTDIDLVNGKWKLPSTSFYYERHFPWMGDYG